MGYLSELDQLANRGISDAFNALGASHGLPPLSWELDIDSDIVIEGTHPDGRAAPGSAELCQRWADLLGLDERDMFGPAGGYATWSGVTPAGRTTVQVDCITDPELYAAEYPEDPI